jgi:Protein of unknown function (DUF3089)
VVSIDHLTNENYQIIRAMNLRNIIFYIIAIVTFNISCTKKNHVQKSAYQFKSANGYPDYSDINYWAAHPWKWDPSDSIPSSLKNETKKDTSVDVFFIYPTSFINNKDERWNAPIDDSAINIKTDYSSILYQASVFNEKCRVFSPRYRQANLKAFYTTDKIKSAEVFDTAYADIKKAFQYYLKNWNNERPIIIASHSQGTVHAARLLKEFFEGKDLQNLLVCAYIIGMPIADNYFTKIKPCKDSLSTGCVVSWRTFKKGYTDTAYVAKENYKTIVTNPLNWKTDTTYASINFNTGGVLKNFNKLKKNAVDAQVHQNILWSSKPKFFGNIFLTGNNYHIGDINLFYNNIRQNIRTRIYMYNLK